MQPVREMVSSARHESRWKPINEKHFNTEIIIMKLVELLAEAIIVSRSLMPLYSSSRGATSGNGYSDFGE